jgi:DNA-binding MarR family transcriptional regulator
VPHSVIFPKERPEQSLGFMFWQATNLWQRRITKALEKLGLTHVQFVLLAGIGWLNKVNSEVTQSMLAKHAKTDIMMTSKVIRTLELKGLINRITHKRDSRAKSLSLTTQGALVLSKALDIVVHVDDEFFSALGSDNAFFMSNLKKLIET